MNPKLLIVIVIVLIAVFVVGIGGGVRQRDRPLDMSLINTGRDITAKLPFKVGSALDLKALTPIEGSAATCLQADQAVLPQNATCTYKIAPAEPRFAIPAAADVRSLSFALTTGRCLYVTLNNASGDALGSEVYVPAADDPTPYAETHPCANPGSSSLTIYQNSGDVLTLHCVEGAMGCAVRFNPTSD